MDVVGSEIGQKMRSAIKAKLTELGCYVDDELPDYVMVMVANKRTRAQMEDDLQLFLGDNTELFVNWLHQVLKKLQEVTVTPMKVTEIEKSKDKVKDKKVKDKKEKVKKTDLKKTKKKDKDKSHKKKEEKKLHKSKKKSKHHEMIRPNVPPLLMNIEKESEPSITDVFAGQILKNHGITIETVKEDKQVDTKPILTDAKRPILPIIDPATISSQPEENNESSQSTQDGARSSVSSMGAPREEQIKEMNQIEAKIIDLKQKLAEQLDSMSDDEDFLNIRTEAEELMNDFVEDVFQEISSQAPIATPPIQKKTSPPDIPIVSKPSDPPKESPKEPTELPQIELKLPKRPVRERLGAKEDKKNQGEKERVKEKEKRVESPERFTPEREPDFWGKGKSAKTRLGDPPEPPKKTSSEEVEEKSESSSKKITSQVSAPARTRGCCASVVRVRPRPRAAPSSSLLLRAMADAHRSLLNIPPKVNQEPQVKRALVHPIRRCVDPQNIVIQVPTDLCSSGRTDSDSNDKESKITSGNDKDEYVPAPLTKKITNPDYIPSRRSERTTSRRDDTLIIETLNIHSTTVDKDKDTQFIVTMDGFNPNAFLAKKLQTEGLLDEDELKDKPTPVSVLKINKTPEQTKELIQDEKRDAESPKEEAVKDNNEETNSVDQKRLSNASEESCIQVIIKKEEIECKVENSEAEVEKSRNVGLVEKRKCHVNVEVESTPIKKKREPIVFDVATKEESKQRERTDSVSSDNHVTVVTTTNTNKYDSLPSLTQAERKLVWCRSFPLCRYGAACAFQHPRCKFAAACTRRNCVYSHPASRPAVAPTPVVASHVVPAANFKTISPALLPSICKFYPNCVNPACHYYHPKPCRYGKACANKLECNFYHHDSPKWRYTV